MGGNNELILRESNQRLDRKKQRIKFKKLQVRRKEDIRNGLRERQNKNHNMLFLLIKKHIIECLMVFQNLASIFLLLPLLKSLKLLDPSLELSLELSTKMEL